MKSLPRQLIALVCPFMLLSCFVTSADTVTANTRAQLIEQLNNAKPGTTIKLAPGTYKGGMQFGGLHGEKGKPITVTALDPDDSPVIQGGSKAIQISSSSHLVLDSLVLQRTAGNVLNIDDGGRTDEPTHHITLRNLTINNKGVKGNLDGIKLSGITDFLIEDCVIEDWGTGGSGIDMVGCHRGVIRGCKLERTDQGATGIQCKGGTSEIRILRCDFKNAGMRHINLGGSTGRRFFRPKLKTKDNAEARDLEVAGCTFLGPGVPVAFVGVDGANVHHNTMVNPSPWSMRILQETATDDFIRCRDGVFADNVIVFKQADLRRFVNVGPNTEPETFTFARNWWYCEDAPGKSRPSLPAAEKGGVYGKDPKLDAAGWVTKQSPVLGVAGAQAWGGDGD